jgi:hypothetical protein
MDTQKNIDKKIMPETMTQPVQETDVQDEFDEMEMQPMPMIEQDTTSMDMPSMNMPCWHCPMMNDETLEMDVQMDEEYDDMKQPAAQQGSMPQMQMEEMTDGSAMRGYRNYYEDYSNYDHNNFNYREFSQYDYDNYDDVDDILRKIERNNPGIFRRLVSYGVPYQAARNIVRRIIRLTLNYK